MSDSEFITARQERYRVAHNSLDPDKLLALMTEDVDYSDHGRLPFLSIPKFANEMQDLV
jgi:hypothetical protein